MNDNLACNQSVPPPLLTLPQLSEQDIYWYVSPRKVKIYEYHTISNGCQRVFTEQDALCEYGEQKILSPDKVSYVNLFINAVLQPSENYTVEEGKITLHTDDIPISGTPINLQMVKIE